MNLYIKTIVTGPFQENSYLLIDKLSNKCVLIDPGDEAHKIINFDLLSQSIKEISLDDLLDVYSKMLKGETSGRYIIDLNK